MNAMAPNPVLRSLARTADFFMKLEHHITDSMRTFRLGLRDGRELMLRYHALARLSNPELAKRGLTRDQLISAVLSDDPARPK